MKRFFRILFNIATLLSFGLCMAIAIFWMRTYNRQPPPSAYADRWLYDHGYLATDAGEFNAVYFDDEHGPDKPFDYRENKWLGIGLSRWQGSSGWNGEWQYTSITMPLWYPVVASGFLPLCWLTIRAFRGRRRKPGFCAKCGYDLRASPLRCPECGAVCKAANPAGESSAAGN